MNIVLLSIALAGQPGNPLAIPVGDHVPVINVEETCKATAATDKAMNLNFAQPLDLHANGRSGENIANTALEGCEQE